MWNRKVFIRIIEVLLCIATVVTLRVTDDESRRVFHYLRSRSREWSLLNNVTWGAIGAALATATCGGYVIITTGLLVAAATGELRGRKTELFFLGLGIILFGIVGALSLASIENVPEDLVDNAAVFGALCLLTALVFIADLLISTPKKKEKPGAMQNFGDKDIVVKRQTTTVTTEKESKTTKSDDTTTPSKLHDNNGNINNGFEKIDDQHQKNSRPEKSDDVERVKRDSPSNSNHRSKDVYHVDGDRNFDRVERQPKEYTQNFENGRTLRDSQRYRDPEMQRHLESEVQRYRDPDSQRSIRRDSHDNDHRMDVPTIIYKTQDIYQRPVDEIDTPRFPTEMNGRTAPMFAKIVNPGVKIMRVEHDVDEAYDAYRYSDMSQYDNVPIRMRGTTSPGILKKNRDVSFNVPPPPKGYAKGHEKTMDEIEMLEECFGSLRTTTTGTQTGVRTPSSPTDPGYVRHTASNWPQELKTKTPSSSPNHTQN